MRFAAQALQRDCPYAIKRRTKIGRLLEIAATKLINLRPFRNEQRAVKRRPKNHPLLNAPRHEYEEVFHRYATIEKVLNLVPFAPDPIQK